MAPYCGPAHFCTTRTQADTPSRISPVIFDSDSAIFVGPVRDNRRLGTLNQRFAMNPRRPVTGPELHAGDIGVVGERNFRIADKHTADTAGRCAPLMVATYSPATRSLRDGKSLSETQGAQAPRCTIERILGFDLFHAELGQFRAFRRRVGNALHRIELGVNRPV